MQAGDNRLINELALSQSVLGIDGIINHLQKARSAHYSDQCISHVFITVNKILGITQEELQVEHSRSDLRKIAFGFHYHFLTQIFHYSCSEIYKSFPIKINQQTLYKSGQLIKKAKIEHPKTDIDKLIAEHIKNLNDQFVKYKNTKVDE